MKNLIFFIKNLKSNKKKLVQKNGWAIQESLFAYTNQFSTFFNTRENSKMFNIASIYFSFFNNEPPPS